MKLIVTGVYEESLPLSAADPDIKVEGYLKREVGDSKGDLYRMIRDLRMSVPEIFLRSTMPRIKNVIFNDPATIVFWADGSKTVVKAQDGDIFDPEKGLTTAITKKALGNKGNYCNELKKWLPKEETLGFCTTSEFEDALRKLSERASKTPFFGYLGEALND